MGSTVKTVFCLLSICSTTLAISNIIPVRQCAPDVPVPTAVTMDCEGMSHGTCVLRKGQTHILTAEFTPGVSSSRVRSYVAWKRWVEMPLPGQNADACQSSINCPLSQGTQATFTYPLEIQDFWMRRRYPMIWNLTDKDTDETILCFIFRIQIV